VFFAWEVIELARKSIHQMATEPVMTPELAATHGLPFLNVELWRNHVDEVVAIFEPADRYMIEQCGPTKHEETLKFLRMANALCPWNADDLTEAVLQYFVEKRLLPAGDVEAILATELPLYRLTALHVGAAVTVRPTPAEYFNRNLPTVLLPEARVWRYWHQLQRLLPRLLGLVKTVAAAQCHSAAAERTGSLFTHDASAQATQTAVQTAVVRERMHYKAVVDPMQNMPLDLDIIDHLA